MNENVLGITAAILTSAAMLPQLIKILKNKNVDDLSWITLLILIVGVSLWVWYGIIKDELPIILSNAFSALINVTLLIFYIIFRNK
ncbi:SemiSWEET transporter [Chryseobacterium fistulae]|uniref:Sugar transporter SemiSWEET n=1 Tax=Chryseobacterium fistulae TaxID=2675058 RepID=A0A6N4XLR8_9FLAO|nr:SemiSWEET transporter [Chryseobacterium fistulae]CAA7386707.1 Sugar transporter SemiSWEET [Chryseobacterium fistulae]